MRRLLWTMLLLFTACSTGAPEDVLLITGRVEGGGPVRLERRLGPAPCFYDLDASSTQEPFEELDSLETGSHGQYAFELYRAQAQPGGDQQACFRILSTAHPRTELRTQLGRSDASLPALISWDGAPTPGADGWQAPPLPDLPEGNVHDEQAQEWQLDTGRGPAWRVFGTQPFAPTPELLEDFPLPTLALMARAHGMDFDQTLGLLFSRSTESHLTLRTPAVAVDAALLVPLTRNAECLVEGSPWATCPWVDGRLDRVRPGPQGHPLVQLELRWAEARTVRTLVLRGLEHDALQLRLELAEGEGEWVEAGLLELEPLDPEVTPSRRLGTPGRWEQLALPQVRADRLRLTAVDGAVSGVRELSVFE